jgi:V/A-type H+-transporting ATPase subunit I
MSLRPIPASWFEMLVLRDDLTVAIDVLAQSSRVELQSHGESSTPLLMPECREMLGEIDELEQRYGRWWPEPRAHSPDTRLEPHAMLLDAIRRLRAWARDAHQLVDKLESMTAERADLQLFASMLADASRLPNLARFVAAGPMLKSCLFVLSGDDWPEVLPSGVITQRAVSAQRTFLLGVGLPQEIEILERQLHMQKARPVTVPANVPSEPEAASAMTRERLAKVDTLIDEARQKLSALHEEHDLADAVADANFVRWYVETVPELSSTENFAWITGWTSDADGSDLTDLLADAGVKGLLRLQQAPLGFEPPLLLSNPPWLQPFELFTGMLGVPEASEVDPTRIVAIASPLIFGYMFGDVGHGAVLLLGGALLSRRFPALRLLIAGGVASIVFGFLFGSVFTLENLLPALWLHPLEDPVLVLLLPMAGGAVLLLIGMFLDALQAYWQKKVRRWLETGAGLVLCYLSLLGAFLEPALLWVALAGALWFVFGHAFVARGKRWGSIGSGTAELLELVLQLAVNTISFVRVGAFSLAHAGLSMAVVGVAAAPASVAVSVLILVLGNLVIIGLEGLVVSIQTTRLVLFEFFIRFLRGEGRPFRPIAPPTSMPPRNHRRPL